MSYLPSNRLLIVNRFVVSHDGVDPGAQPFVDGAHRQMITLFKMGDLKSRRPHGVTYRLMLKPVLGYKYSVARRKQGTRLQDRAVA